MSLLIAVVRHQVGDVGPRLAFRRAMKITTGVRSKCQSRSDMTYADAEPPSMKKTRQKNCRVLGVHFEEPRSFYFGGSG